jgi:NAD-dependent deacetylase
MAPRYNLRQNRAIPDRRVESKSSSSSSSSTAASTVASTAAAASTTDAPKTKIKQKSKPKSSSSQPAKRPRRSGRGSSVSIQQLADLIVSGKNVVIITGAGLSVASGVRPFRTSSAASALSAASAGDHDNHKKGGGHNKTSINPTLPREGLWNDVIWTTATREAFRKDPLSWYNDFWMPHFMRAGCTITTAAGTTYYKPKPNRGHYALQELLELFPNCKEITQNIDALQPPQAGLIEVHGRLNLYKCCPDRDESSESDNDDGDDKGDAAIDSDEDSDDSQRRVHLGHRAKSREKRHQHRSPDACPYQFLQSLTPCQIEPASARDVLNHNDNVAPNANVKLTEAPTCPACGNPVMPQALLFDEGYHSHTFYQFERAEEWLSQADCLVFLGTSFAVRLTSVALDHARAYSLPVYNFNLADASLPSTIRLSVSNVVGPAIETLPALVEACREQQEEIEADVVPSADLDAKAASVSRKTTRTETVKDSVNNIVKPATETLPALTEVYREQQKENEVEATPAPPPPPVTAVSKSTRTTRSGAAKVKAKADQRSDKQAVVVTDSSI